MDGCRFPATSTALDRQLWLFRHAPRLQVDPFWRPGDKRSEFGYMGTGRYSHCRAMIEMLMPSFEWHEWSEQQIAALCEHSQVGMSGGGGSGKSTSTGAYAIVFVLSGLEDSAVLIASTTVQAAIQRIWKSVSMFYRESVRVCGGALGETTILGKPRPELRATPKDLSHGIFVVPVAGGDVQKGIDELKGRHPRRLLLIGDETDSISQAIVEVQDNLRVGTEEFQAVWLGNLPSMFNPLGKIMEPAPNTPVSEACGLEWTSTTGVHCLRFDGEFSPNITGEEKWRGLPRQRDLDAILRRNHGVKGQQYYIMVKGLPPPEGVDDTVLSEATLTKFHVRDAVTWRGEVIAFAALDPGFGGDPCVLKLFRRGADTEGTMRIFVSETIEIPVSAADTVNPAEYQIAKRVQETCIARQIAPEEFIVDSTGIGRGVASVLQREWSPKIEVCNFSEAASERPVSNEDQRRSSEAYDRLVSELWFSVREFVQADMIRGMDIETARELTQRRFELKNRKLSLEKKEDMKARGVPSPNNGDAIALGVELCRRKGINAMPQGAVATETDAGRDALATEWDMEGREDCYATFG